MCDKLKSSTPLHSPYFFPPYSESAGHFTLAAYFVMFSHAPTDTFPLIAREGLGVSTPPALQSFAMQQRYPPLDGHLEGASTFWATHIPLHQLRGLKDPSRVTSWDRGLCSGGQRSDCCCGALDGRGTGSLAAA